MLNEMILCEELFHTPTGVAFAENGRLGSRPTLQVPNTDADDADGTDAKASFRFGQFG